MSEDPMLLGDPLSDRELDEIEQAARAVLEAVRANDLDSAYIIATTCEEPAILAMYVAAMSNDERQ